MHERPPRVPTAWVLIFTPLELKLCPEHLCMFIRRIRDPQVDSFEQVTVPLSPIILVIVCCEPVILRLYAVGRENYNLYVVLLGTG